MRLIGLGALLRPQARVLELHLALPVKFWLSGFAGFGALEMSDLLEGWTSSQVDDTRLLPVGEAAPSEYRPRKLLFQLSRRRVLPLVAPLPTSALGAISMVEGMELL